MTKQAILALAAQYDEMAEAARKDGEYDRADVWACAASQARVRAREALAAAMDGDAEPALWVDPLELIECQKFGGMLVGTMHEEATSKRVQPLYASPSSRDAAPVVGEDAKDAARYRWMRTVYADLRIIHGLAEEAFDEAVDEAMKADHAEYDAAALRGQQGQEA